MVWNGRQSCGQVKLSSNPSSNKGSLDSNQTPHTKPHPQTLNQAGGHAPFLRENQVGEPRSSLQPNARGTGERGPGLVPVGRTGRSLMRALLGARVNSVSPEPSRPLAGKAAAAASLRCAKQASQSGGLPHGRPWGLCLGTG